MSTTSKLAKKKWGDCWRWEDGKPCPTRVEDLIEKEVRKTWMN